MEQETDHSRAQHAGRLGQELHHLAPVEQLAGKSHDSEDRDYTYSLRIIGLYLASRQVAFCFYPAETLDLVCVLGRFVSRCTFAVRSISIELFGSWQIHRLWAILQEPLYRWVVQPFPQTILQSPLQRRTCFACTYESEPGLGNADIKLLGTVLARI